MRARRVRAPRILINRGQVHPGTCYLEEGFRRIANCHLRIQNARILQRIRINGTFCEEDQTESTVYWKNCSLSSRYQKNTANLCRL